jgi:hypothetical protein
MAHVGMPAESEPATDDRRPDERGTLTLGIVVADHGSRELAAALQRELPRVLERRFPDVRWDTKVQETAPADPSTSSAELLDRLRQCLLHNSWGLAVGLTALPLHTGRRPVSAYASAQQSVAVVSVPALGAVAVQRRLRETVTHLIEGMLGESLDSPTDDGRPRRHARMRDRALELASPLNETDSSDDGSLRLVSATLRGNLRLLVGMIRANRPTLVIVRLSKAVIGALSAGALTTVTATLWQLSDQLGWPRMTVLLLVAVIGTCVALVAAHGLWEHARERAARERVILFNFATVATLGLGVLSLYAALFAIFTLANVVVIPGRMFEQNVGHPLGVANYFQHAWFVASIAMIGGALGSLIESDAAVRDAAYRPRTDARIELSRDGGGGG